MKKKAPLLAFALVLAACGVEPELYLLPPPVEAPRAAPPASTIAVAEIGLPTYADTVEIAFLAPTGMVAVDRDSLWADTPRRALTRHLVAALDLRLRARVAAEPWHEFESPGLRIEVVVDRMIGGTSEEMPLNFAGQYLVVSPNTGRLVTSDRFDITLFPGEGGYQPLIDAHARAIEVLADEIAASISRLSSGLI
ncbi:ABC-type transport auxiliary lipoprotein family protein [soil metagenome]